MLKRLLARKNPLLGGIFAAIIPIAMAALMPQSWRDIAVAQSEDVLMRATAGFHQSAGSPARIVVVDIDQATIQEVGAWPWPRERLANLVDRLASTKPAAVAFDMLLADADPRSPLAEIGRRGIGLEAATLENLKRAVPDGDALLADALARVPSVLGLVLGSGHPDHVPAAQVLIRGSGALLPLWQGEGVVGPHHSLLPAVSGLGVIAMPGDGDGVIRRLPLFVAANNRPYPGLALETLRVGQEASAFFVEGPPAAMIVGALRLRLPENTLLRLIPGRFDDAGIRHISAREFLAGTRSIEQGTLVLIGGSAPELGGLRTAQDDTLVPAVTIQARGLAQLLSGVVPMALPNAEAISAGLVVLMTALAIAAALTLGPIYGLGALAGGLLCLFSVSSWAFISANWLWVPLLPAITSIMAFSGSSVILFVEVRRREARIRHRFEQHLAPQVVSMIVADPSLLKLKGEKREITALFTDVEDFTAMTERADPETLVQVLDTYFEGLAEILVRHGSMIDKIVGDALHAFFNAPVDLMDHPAKALACAIEMANWSAKFCKSPAAAAIGFGRTRIGIETGPAIVGDVGIRSKLDYTAHGAVVNSAARLEAANKLFGSTICLGPKISSLLPKDALRPLGEVRLRGFSKASRVFEPWPETALPQWRQRYLDALQMADIDPAQAAGLFRALASEASGDMVCRVLALKYAPTQLELGSPDGHEGNPSPAA